MPVTWYALCVDVTVPAGGPADQAEGAFWAAALGLEHVHQPAYRDDPGDPGDLVAPGAGAEGEVLVALCPVPEPTSVKNRVHLDVRARSVEELTALGARVFDRQPRWTTLTAPGGGELCAFVDAEGREPERRFHEVIVDAARPEEIARWWAARFDVAVRNDGEPWWWLEDLPGAPFDALVFQPVPEPKTVKNRVHWDVRGEEAALLAAGARELWREPGWVVLADPEGNEFCCFPPA